MKLPRALLLLAAAVLPAPAEGVSAFELFPVSVPPSHYLPADGVVPAAFAPLLEPSVAEEPPPPSAPAPKLLDKKTTLLSGGVLAGGVVYGLTAGWAYGFNAFQFGDEGWFGEDTYAGGADKASHFIVTLSLARELALAYDFLGHPKKESTALSFGVVAFAGLLVEIGDGFSPYGFSWEDLTADVLGAATGLALTRTGLNDLIGIRVGIVPIDIPPDPCCVPLRGTGYSKEIYSADLKFSGLAKRVRWNPGPARFLMLSATYDTRAYGYTPARPDRQRNVGVELGLNIPEILSAAGVPKTTWWGISLYKTFEFFRVPFTSFGFHYDLNSGTWRGPDTGNKFE